MVTISMCMIVKNEEKVLERCLSSYAPLMDEIIIIDTGSSDKTKEIAARFTDKIYDFEWINDFSAARNYAFSYATCDYIFSADADEVLDEENRKQFALLKEVLDEEIEIVQMKYGNQLDKGTVYNYDCELRPKLFKRLRKFTWIEPVHETVRTLPVVFDSDIVITHLPETLHTKRDIAIFERMVNNGQTISKRLRTMYAKELYISGEKEEFLKATPLFESIYQDDQSSIDERQEAACVLAKAYKMCGLDAKFVSTIILQPYMLCSELCYETGNYFEKNEVYDEALAWYENAICQTEAILNVKYSDEYPKTAILRVKEKLRDIAQ